MASRIGGSFSAASKAALTFGASLVTIAAAREFLRIADSAKQMDAQLRLATQATGSFATAQEDVRRIAMATRSGLEETTELYGSFLRNARELGITQEEAARATETVSKTFKISGASASEAANSTRQLVQALQSGVLRGDEFNSVMEGAPRLAKLIADSLGVTVGQLRKMAEEGKLTSEALTEAFTNKKFTEQIDEEIKGIPVSFDQAMQQVENAATITFGAFDRGGQFSNAIVNFITMGSDGFEELEQSALDFGIEVRAQIEGLASAFAPVFAEAERLFAYLKGGIGNMSFDWGNELRDVDRFTGWLSQQGPLGAAFTNNTLSDWWNGKATGTNFEAPFRKRYQQSVTEGRRRTGSVGRALGRLSEANRQAGQSDTPSPRSAPTSSGGGGGRSSQAAAQRSAEAAARRAEQDRLRAIREEAANARDGMRLDHEILSAKEALATAAEDVLRYQLDQIEIERKQRVADIEADVKLGNLTREEADKRILINNELAQYQNDLAKRREEEAIYARDAAGLRDRQATLQAEAQLARSRVERRDIEEKILALAYAEEEAAIRRAYANGDIADLDEALANLRRRQLADQEVVNRNSYSPGQSYLSDLQTEAENLGDAYENIAVRGLENMNRQLSEAVKNGLGLHGVLGDIIGDFIELAIRQQVLGPLANAIFSGGSLFGGGGGAFASSSGFNSTSLGMSSLAGARAGGGYVEGGKLYRVNEGAKVEAFRPQGSGEIIPLGEMAAMRGGGTVSQHITIQVNAEGALLATQVQRMVREGMETAAQIGVSGGAAEGERRILSRSRRTIPR